MHRISTSVLLLLLIASTIPLHPAEAAHSVTLSVQTFALDGTVKRTFEIPTSNEIGGAKVALGDLGNDGVAEILIGNGLGNSPTVTVYRNGGTKIGSFLAYEEKMGSGITLAVCDPDGDGVNDIATGTQFGAGPHVRLFDQMGVPKDGAGFMAYNESFHGGVNVACGDLDQDGKDELITSPGPSGGPHTKIWSFGAGGWNMVTEFFAFDGTETNGLLTTVNNGILYAALQKPKLESPKVRQFILSNGVHLLQVQDISSSSTNTLGFAGGNLLRTSFPDSTVHAGDTTIHVDTSFGAVSAASIDMDHDGQIEIVTVSDKPAFADWADRKRIVVDLSEQRLYAFEGGILANSFLVSTARYGYTTPIGDHSVLANPRWVNYSWSYSAGNPNNYNLGMVEYNLRIYPHIYIHYAPWHNNFGHPMSHGCINVNLTNIQWTYDWAEVSIPVKVQA